MVWLVFGLGCDFDAIRQQFDGLTNPLVAEALVIGVAEPTDERIDLSVLDDYDPGANATVFLADATSVTQLDEALVSGALVNASDGSGSTDLAEVQDGVYVTEPPTGLDYVAGRTLMVTAQLGDDTGRGSLVLPPGAGLGPIEDHGVGQPIDLDLTGLGYTGGLIVVIDVASGSVTYSNEPTDARGIYELARGSTELTIETVPGEAFPTESVYALGFAGLVRTRSSDFDGFNTALSSILAGQLEFVPVSTVSL